MWGDEYVKWEKSFYNVCLHEIITIQTLNILHFCQLYLSKAGGGERK